MGILPAWGVPSFAEKDREDGSQESIWPLMSLPYMYGRQMSLTYFLKSSPDVRKRFKAEFLMPPLAGIKQLLAQPLTENASLVGTAFDYLLRFYLERLNPNAKTRKWVAKEAVLDDTFSEDEDFRPPICREILKMAVSDHKQYLENGEISNALLRSVLWLAKLDVLIRRDVEDSFYDTLSKTDAKDIQDLRRLISLVQPEMFKAKNMCALNPDFGRASELVGGADSDIIIDDALIEIKTSKHFRVERSYFNQLVGYYVLFRIGGIEGVPEGHQIKRLGIYFSRYGYLWLFDVSAVIKEKELSGFIRWFKKRAKQDYDPIIKTTP
jgi:hypothetical protein